MLFSKLKSKHEEELLPPPFPSMELEEKPYISEAKPKKAKAEAKDEDFEEELKEKPKFFDEFIKKPKSETFTEEEEFNRLVKDLNEGLKPLAKKEEAISKKKTIIKKQKLSKKEIKKSNKATKRWVQSKKLVKIKPIKQAKKQKASLAEDGFDLENLDFELPKELEQPKVEFPETLEDFDIEREFKQKTKPKEILEAEEEIQSAIEKIKKREKPSILKSLFSRKREETSEERLILEPQGNVSRIQSKINDARQALMRFDLETAKRSYIEAMRLYNNISPEDKAKVYHDIKELYSERKSAEELKV